MHLIEQLTSEIERFHMPEVHDKLVPSLFQDVKKGNTQMRQAVALCMAKVLANQHDSQRRQSLMQQIIQDFAESKAF